ncbi:MAG: hypothetical protein J1F38_07195 [Muribaculaceae bacterium]|nr:hypothetical protein [Muribaculaceae bacterium]
MIKTFTKKLYAGAILAACTLSANAVEYITVPPVVTPKDGYIGGPQGTITVAWPGVSLEMDNQDKDHKTPVDLSYVNITVNDNPVSINPNEKYQGKIYVGAQETEEEGRIDDMLAIVLPDEFFNWKGNVKIDILEGAVTSTSGAINEAISLNYTFIDLNYDAIWDPARPDDGTDVILVKGEAYLYVSWEGYSNLSITSDADPFYQKATADDNGIQVSARQYMSIEDDRVKFDLTSFDTGIYILDLTEGSIDLGDGTPNGETVYNFRILETLVPQSYVSPMPSSYDEFDSFNVIWAENINQPYELSSQYAALNDDSGKLEFNAEGISQFKVSLNNAEEVEIRSITIEEFQADESGDSYPDAQLLITLADMQTEIDGEYSLLIPAGIINITTPYGIVVNDEVTFTFILNAQEVFELPDPTVIPTEGAVKDLKEVIISWQSVLGGWDLLTKNEENSGEITVTLNDEEFTDFETSFTWSSIDAQTEGTDGNQLVITFGDNLDPGTYSIMIPEGYINVTDIDNGTYPSQLINLTYTLEETTGIDNISSDDNVTIYNLNGVKVDSGVKKSSVNNLPKGIYIVNGKKVVVF